MKWQVDIYGWYALAYGKTVFRPANLRTTRRRTPAVSNSFMNEARMKPRLQVHIAGRAPYDVKITQQVNVIQLSALKPGARWRLSPSASLALRGRH